MSPYEILGINEGAGINSIDEAYKQKLIELDSVSSSISESEYNARRTILENAYDEIVLSHSGHYSSSGVDNKQFGDIRAKIRAGRNEDAEILLDGFSTDKRDAQWYYLKGLVQYNKGWLEEAYLNFEKAVNMAPDNEEYKKKFDEVNDKRSGRFKANRFNKSYPDSEANDCTPCNMCTGMLCANAACDLCPCTCCCL